MISLPHPVRVFLHTPATDLRKGFDGLSGLVTTAFGAAGAAKGLVIQPQDGRLVAVGSSSATIGEGSLDFALARYESGLVLGVGPPTNKEECKQDGWRTFNVPRAFKNQGDCIQFVNTGA